MTSKKDDISTFKGSRGTYLDFGRCDYAHPPQVRHYLSMQTEVSERWRCCAGVSVASQPVPFVLRRTL